MTDKLMANNKGMSLVELIAVISIMAVLTGIASFSVSMMFSRDAESAATIIDDALTEARLMSMSKPGNFVMEITCNKDGNISGTGANLITIKNDIASGTAGHYEKTINFKTKAYIWQGATAPSYPMDADGSFEIIFDKSNGSVKSINGTNVVSASEHLINCTAVKNTSKVSTVSIMTVSGKHFVNR